MYKMAMVSSVFPLDQVCDHLLLLRFVGKLDEVSHGQACQLQMPSLESGRLSRWFSSYRKVIYAYYD